MKDFYNRNYHRSPEPPGVYRLLKQQSIRKNGKVTSQTLNFYFVRVPREDIVGARTVSKCKTREEAERIFRENCPDWKGEIPYYEIISPFLRKRYKL